MYYEQESWCEMTLRQGDFKTSGSVRNHRVLPFTGAMLIVLVVSATAGASIAQSTASGQLSSDSPAAAEQIGLEWPDWILIVCYAASTIGLGWYFGRRQRSTEEYFIGGGNMSPSLIGVSLFATLLSTISYLSMPGEVIGKGPVILTSLLALPLVYWIVGYVLIPVYMRQRVTSAYELLEVRLGVGIRVFGAFMFIILRLVWMSLLVYMAAKAMAVMLGVDDSWIPWIVLTTGGVAVIYTSMGGLRAVVITDLLQSILLLGGALLIIATVTIKLGGFRWIPTAWQSNWDTQPFFSLNPSTRVTVLGSILSLLIWYVCTAGGDQTSVQRFMATRDARSARRAFATQLIVATLVTAVLSMVGFALLAYFNRYNDAFPSEMSVLHNADDIFPYYIAYRLPVGISGLVVAAMFAAAMSSVDSGVNSITAVVMTDFLDRFGVKPKTALGHVRTAQLLAFAIGTVVVVGSSFVEHVPGNFTAVAQKTTNLLVTPIFALFIFALFIPFSTSAGVLVGAVCGTTTALLIAFSGPIFGTNSRTGADPVSFQWIAPAALLVNLIAGSGASALLKWVKKSNA